MIKLFIFWFGAFFGILGCSIGCKIYRPLTYWILAAMVFALFFDQLSIHFLSAESYRGTSRGFEIHLSDLLAVVLFINILQDRKRYKIIWLPPMTAAFGLLLFSALLSWVFTDSSLYNPASRDPVALFLKEDFLESLFLTGRYPLFEISKALRGYFIFWVTVNFMNDKKAIQFLIGTATCMLLYSALASLIQRYALGVYRVTLLSDINIFNCFVGMLGSLVMPFLFYTKDLRKTTLYLFATVACLLSILLTVSRSSLLGFGLAMIFITLFGLLRFPSAKNFFTVAATFFLCLGLFAKASETLLRRFTINESFSSSMVDRNLYGKAALLMGQEHFFGVGVNNFSAFSASSYGERTGAEPGALAHNIWYLTYAEMGLPGLLAFGWFWLCYYLLLLGSFIEERKKKDDFVYTLLIALFAAMFILQVQDLFHFSYRFTSIYFLSCIIVGLTARISLQQKEIKNVR